MRNLPLPTRTFLAGMITGIAFSCAAHGEAIPLWPDGAPGSEKAAAQDIPTLTIHPLPQGAESPVPAVLLIPGGGYKHISSYKPYQDFFRNQPVRLFAMKYRLPGRGFRHPAPLQDATRAIRMLRAHAVEWGVDPSRVLVLGFSSGGHVASTLATHFTEGNPDAADPVERCGSRPDALALFCPVISMKNHPHGPSVARLLGPEPDPRLIDELSNELQVTAKTPPTLLLHAKDDRLVPPENSILFHEALKKAGVKTTLRLYEQGGHNVTDKANPWAEDLSRWLVELGYGKK